MFGKRVLLTPLIAGVLFIPSFAQQKQYSMEEIYNKMCIECHSSDGSGNTDKLTPSMKEDSLEEIEAALKEVENSDICHIVMGHNREKILEKGMEYKAKPMAKYMFNRFNKK